MSLTDAFRGNRQRFERYDPLYYGGGRLDHDRGPMIFPLDRVHGSESQYSITFPT